MSESLVNQLQAQKLAVTVWAIGAMCEHYQCAVDALTLTRSVNPPAQRLQKDIPGLAYLIKLQLDGEGGRWVAEPIYLREEE